MEKELMNFICVFAQKKMVSSLNEYENLMYEEACRYMEFFFKTMRESVDAKLGKPKNGDPQ